MNNLTLRAGISTDDARLASGGWSSLPSGNRPAGFDVTETAAQPILARIAEQNATYFDEDLAKLEDQVSAQSQII